MIADYGEQAVRGPPRVDLKVSRPIVVAAVVVAALGGGSPNAAAQENASESAWVVLGGVAGSLAGYGLGSMLDFEECGANAFCLSTLALAASFVGSPGGALAAGKWAGSDPSLLGAVLGAVVGTATGMVIVSVLDETGSAGGAVPVVIWGVSQGALSAAGAWLLGSG